MAERDTLLNAVIGAVATAVLNGFVPLAPVLGGALAGYLEGGDRAEGLRVGAISGILGLVLDAVIVAVVLVTFLLIGTPPLFSAVSFLVIAVVVAFVVVYVVGLSAVGGWVGNYVKHDTGIGS